MDAILSYPLGVKNRLPLPSYTYVAPPLIVVSWVLPRTEIKLLKTYVNFIV
jgi:hypothetical protein